MSQGKQIFLAPGAYVGGDVTLGNQIGIWYNAVVRGDSGPIEIGDESNVQDNCTIHTDPGHKVVIGKGVTIGHNAIVHGCTIGDNSVIGMGSILLNGAKPLVAHILKCDNLIANLILCEFFSWYFLVFEMIRAVNAIVYAVI